MTRSVFENKKRAVRDSIKQILDKIGVLAQTTNKLFVDEKFVAEISNLALELNIQLGHLKELEKLEREQFNMGYRG